MDLTYLDKDEAKFQLLGKLAQELGVFAPLPYLGMEVRVNKNLINADPRDPSKWEAEWDKGSPVFLRNQRSRSWNRNAYNMMFSNLAAWGPAEATFGPGSINYRDTGGTVRYISTASQLLCMYFRYPSNNSLDGAGYKGVAEAATRGISLGSSDAAESFENYWLGSPISNGVTENTLVYVAMPTPTKSYNDGTKVLTMQMLRYYNNNSGGNINVNEVAICGSVEYATTVTSRICMTSRDKLVGTVTVPDTGQLKVTYEISLTYPS